MKNILLLLTLALTLAQSCKTSNSVAIEEANEAIPEAFKGKILVSLMPEVNTSKLESDFSKYALKHLSIASKSKNQHLFGFDTNKISAQALLKKLNKSRDVYLAEPLAARMNKATLMSSDEKKQIDIK